LRTCVVTAFNSWSKSACQYTSSFVIMLSMEEAKCAISSWGLLHLLFYRGLCVFVFVWFSFTAQFCFFSFCDVLTFHTWLNMIICKCVVLLYYLGAPLTN
jgi:hypothetical protein